jgi:metallo-beta-lactamase class B
MRVSESGRNYNVVFANIGSVIGAKLIGNPKYPAIADDFARTFRTQKALVCDVFLAAHGSQYGMKEKFKAQYNPNTFVDREGYQRAIDASEAKYLDQLKQEQPKLR